MSRKRKQAVQQALFATPRWLETELREQQQINDIIGIDEAGRGPLAGPVVAAAAIFSPSVDIPELNDSKKLSESLREQLFPVIHQKALAVGVGVVCAAEIDRLNILQATKKAMELALQHALRQLDTPPELVLIDGNQTFPSEVDIKQMAVVKGDQRCHSIAAASVVAKVTRDKIMAAYDGIYPQYDFSQHKGYPTPLHKERLIEHGPSPLHRLSFRGVLPDSSTEKDEPPA
jgi:ribonuclease HII